MDESGLQGMRVLLVEDNHLNQQLAQTLLRARGVEIDTCENGREALEHLLSLPADHYHLILMDLQMPEMDGFEATRRLRADSRYVELPIVAMTAHALAEERQRGLDMGMNDYLTKPFEPDRLFALLASYFSNKASGEAMQSEQAPTELPAIPGINIQQGVKRCGGSADFYRQMLTEFHNHYHDVLAKMELVMRDADWGELRRLSHTLKSLAGTLGLEAVQPRAAALEHAADAKAEDCKELLAKLAEELLPILSALQQLVGPRAGEAAVNPELMEASESTNAEG